MNGSGDHYAKKNEPDSQIQVLHDFFHMWNLGGEKGLTAKGEGIRDVEGGNGRRGMKDYNGRGEYCQSILYACMKMS
jgi:hypothetical protein